MDQQTLLNIMTVFVIVSALALIVQAGTLLGIYKASRTLEQTVTRMVPKVEVLLPKVEALLPKVEAMLPRVEALVESSLGAVEDSRKLIQEVTVKTGAILDSTQKQLARIDDVLEDASGRARIQFDRAELLLDDAMTRAQETVILVHRGVMKPLREIQGVAAGVRSAINFLTRARRADPAHATADEEMFI
jgi:hypothetical protein